MSRFPDYFPEHFESILPPDVEYIQKRAYRLAVYGVDNPQSYLPTVCSDAIRGYKRKPPLPILDNYSTSCYTTYEKIRIVRATAFKKVLPRPKIAVGTIEPEHGPTLTESDGHIHWWVYMDVHPESFFREEMEKSD